MGVLSQSNHLLNVAQMIGVGPEGAAQKAVCLAAAEQHRSDQGTVASHLGRCDVARQAVPLAPLVIGLSSIVDGILIVEACDVHVAAKLKAKTKRFDLVCDH